MLYYTNDNLKGKCAYVMKTDITEKEKKTTTTLNSSKIYFPHDLEVKYDLDISSPIKQPNRLRVYYVIADEVY